MSNSDLANATWFKSSYSNGTGECIEIAAVGEAVAMRDSKDQSGPTLVFTPGEFNAFVRGAVDGEFNNL